jgi:hypothetical protein
MKFVEKDSAHTARKSGKRAVLWILLGVWALLVLLHSGFRPWHLQTTAPAVAAESYGTEVPGIGRDGSCGSSACTRVAPEEPKTAESDDADELEAPPAPEP